MRQRITMGQLADQVDAPSVLITNTSGIYTTPSRVEDEPMMQWPRVWRYFGFTDS